MRPTIHPIHTPFQPTTPLPDHPPVLVRHPQPPVDTGRSTPAPGSPRPMLAPLPG